MNEILWLVDPDRLGFIHDVGRAQTKDRLGSFSNESWLKSYAGRMIGAHHHNVTGIHDHRTPGSGEVDLRWKRPTLSVRLSEP